MKPCIRTLLLTSLCAGACGAAVPVFAAAAEPTSGPVVEARYRFENVDDAAFARDAQAHTLRLRLGYRWVFAPGWQLYADAEHVQPLFGEHYNSTANGRTQYPVVADPKATELNQAFVAWQGAASGATLGRQRVMLDNQRFIGNVGWRQNEQTFDALAFNHSFAPDGFRLDYYYLNRVLRVFGDDHPDRLQARWRLNGHLLHLAHPVPAGQVVAYGYWINNRDMPNLSTRNFGLRWSGQKDWGEVMPGWTFEAARQADWGNNPAKRSATYRFAEGSLKWRGVTFRLGQEILGGDGTYGFATPYATLHAFNGWADRFGTTPKDGLDDRYVGAGGGFGKGFNWNVTWHDYRADHGGASYGQELDASLGWVLDKHWNFLAKVADYREDGFSTDARKYWLMAEYRY